jgi:hypothetical protein
MPDVREVYETITSQKPPAPGAFERQQKRQVRSARNKRIAAFAVAGVIALGAVALILDARTERHANRPVNEPSTPVRQPSPLLPARPTPSSSISTRAR